MSTTDAPDLDAIAKALAAPFEASEVKFKPQTISGNRALAVPFVDARVVMDRLDDVLGIWGWEDRYQPQADGSVLCSLTLRVGGQSTTKSDVGGQSEQPDEGDRAKAAVSDALKRAAVKFGIGRYLYRQKPQWCDWDAQKRQFVRQPILSGVAPAPVAQTPDWLRGLHAYDAKLAEQRLCQQGDLVKHVAAAGKKGGFPADMTAWNETQVADARAEAKHFEQQRRAALQKTA